MIRTPPRRETLNKYSILTSPESPSAANSDGEPDGSPARDEEETPRPRGSNFGKLDTLSNEDRTGPLHGTRRKLRDLGARILGNSTPCQMRRYLNISSSYSLCSKRERVRTTRSSIDPPQASRPAIAQHPSEDLNKIEYVNFQPAQTSQRHSRVENSTQSRKFPPLPARPQKSRTPPAPAQTHKDRPQHTAGCPTKPDRLAKSPNDKIPPIILRDKTHPKHHGRNPHFSRFGGGFPRIVQAFLQRWHTFSYILPSEKLLNVVLRSVPTEIHVKDIYNDLVERGFVPECVIRMRRPRDKAPIPLVLIKIDKKHKDIYHLREVVSLDVTVEALQSRPTIGQCFRCQRFGHAQSRCSAQRKCVACAGEHDARDCPRPKSDPATCVNCGEQHPASYRGCTRFPKPRAQTPNPQKQPSLSGIRPIEGHSYSQALSGAHKRPQAITPKSPRVSWRTNPTPLADGTSIGDSGPEDAKVEKLMDVLQDLFVQIEAVTKVITQMFHKKPKTLHGAT
ncbi:zinc finger associated protein [Popillia japonica]|uniref:Zinc finger associated protein n=1 Tax=Popillia japonica TaxID=7064 RepID=A0AAW1JJ94_POPJA